MMCPCKISVFRKIILSQTSSLSPRWNVLRLKILSIQYLTRKPQELTKYHLASSKRVCRLWSLVLPLLLTLLLEAEFSQLLGKLLKSDQFLRTEIMKKLVVMTNFAADSVQYVAQYPDTSVSDCNNFPLLIARALKFGPEKIYLVLNMTKDSLTFLPLFPSRN